MKINLSEFESYLLSEVSLKHEADTDEYIRELDDLIVSMRNLKDSLGRGPERLKHRKERHRLQGAIEAVRFLKRASERRLKKKDLLSEGGAKIPPGQGASLTPEVVVQASELYKGLIEDFNQYLSSKDLRPVKAIKPVGSTAYYREDLEEDSDVIYGDIDFLVSLPPADGGEDFGVSRKSQAAIKRNYEKEFLNFLKASPPGFVDVPLTGESSPTMVIINLDSGKKVQVDLIATTDRYEDWMQVRWVPERGVKGYVGGNLYKAFGDTLTLTIGDQGVIARIKDGNRVSSKQRGKDVKFIQVSSNPSTFFKDIVDYLVGAKEFEITQGLADSQGIAPDNITISGIADGIRAVAETLQGNGALPEKFNNSVEMLEEVLARFKLNLDASVEKKSKNQNMTEEKLTKLVKMNSEQYNNVKNSFNL